MAESENGCHHAQRSDKNNEGKRANEQKMLCRNQTPVFLVVYMIIIPAAWIYLDFLCKAALLLGFSRSQT